MLKDMTKKKNERILDLIDLMKIYNDVIEEA
jgi:hypothetical protein